MTSTDEQRAKFEAWAKNGFELHRNGGAEYSSMITQAAWAAWQAALAAQEGTGNVSE